MMCMSITHATIKIMNIQMVDMKGTMVMEALIGMAEVTPA